MNKRLNHLTVRVSVLAANVGDDHPLAMASEFLSAASDDLCDANMHDTGSADRALALASALQNVTNVEIQSERLGFPASLRIEINEFAQRFEAWIESLQA